MNCLKTFKSVIPYSLIIVVGFSFSSCSEDDDDNMGNVDIDVPVTYEFTRDGETSVSFSGQEARLDQLSEIKAILQKGDAGEEISATVLKDMYENTNGDGGGNFSFTAEDKQLKNKTFLADQAYFDALIEAAATASVAGADGTMAEDGVAGLIERESNGSNILVDENGHEFTQFIEKGIMGATFLHQIYNVYLTDDRVGDDVDNETLVDGSNYTAIEHHWDEAFGYFGVPIDFPTTTTDRFWGNYCNGRDGFLGTNAILMDAFLKGRTAIVNNQSDIKNEQREVIYEGFELVVAATAIHYLNDTKESFNDGDTGNAFHVLSEAYTFIRALQFSPKKKISDEQLTTLLETNIGENFWDVAESDLSGINNAIDTLASIYTDLESVKSDL